MVRIGVAGAGAWGRNLLRNVSANPDMELSAVCDPSPEARRAAGLRYPTATLFDSLDRMIDYAGLDAVIIATPSRAHFEHAQRALDAGLHVLVEKPLSMCSQEALVLIELARKRRRLLAVGHTFLYSNLVHEVKRHITGGALGDVHCIYGQRLNLGRVRRDVDALWNFAPHDISIISYLLDEWPHAVNARGGSFIQRAEGIADVAFFQMDFSAGRLAGGHVSWLDPRKVRRMVVVGSQKMLVYDDVDSEQPIQIYDKSVRLEFQSSAEDFCDFRTKVLAGALVVPNIRLVEPLSVEVSEFARCVHAGAQPIADGTNGLRVVCVLEAMSRSMAAGGAPVDVEYVGPDDGQPPAPASCVEPPAPAFAE